MFDLNYDVSYQSLIVLTLTSYSENIDMMFNKAYLTFIMIMQPGIFKVESKIWIRATLRILKEIKVSLSMKFR